MLEFVVFMNVRDWCIVMVGVENRLAFKHGAQILKRLLLVHEVVVLLLMMLLWLLLGRIHIPAMDVDLLWVS